MRLPAATLRTWLVGRAYPKGDAQATFHPLIKPASTQPLQLSFYNLIEAFTLNAMRRTEHHVSMPSIRKALDYVKRQTRERRPLLTEKFLTDSVDLFLDKYGQLVAVSKDGQLAIRAVMMDSLTHVGRDSKGMPSKLYLFVAPAAKPDASEVVIDPRIAFGSPIVDGTGISMAVLAQRYKAGDSIDELAEDFGFSRDAVEQAIRYEVIPLRKAA